MIGANINMNMAWVFVVLSKNITVKVGQRI
jgi:hypothetical protein